MEAVILILKHATFLHLSNSSSESALTNADLDYQEANIDLKIQQHLTSSSQEHSVKEFSGFIETVGVGLCILASVKIISPQVFAELTHLLNTTATDIGLFVLASVIMQFQKFAQSPP